LKHHSRRFRAIFEPKTKESIMSSGTTDKVKGRVKEAAGALTDDKKLKNEGKADQAIGKIKNAAENTLDKAKKIVRGE
jgi:uncharacterized protein YjbJ (UPF0337 family)